MSFTHLHLLLNHFPVIGMTLGIALLAVAILKRSDELGKVSLGLFVALAVISIIVFFTGEPAEEAIENLPGFSDAITERHEEFALIATIAISGLGALGLMALGVFRGKTLPRWITLTGLTLSLAAGGLMGYTAMLGGQVRHTEVRPDASAAAGMSQEKPD